MLITREEVARNKECLSSHQCGNIRADSCSSVSKLRQMQAIVSRRATWRLRLCYQHFLTDVTHASWRGHSDGILDRQCCNQPKTNEPVIAVDLYCLRRRKLSVLHASRRYTEGFLMSEHHLKFLECLRSVSFLARSPKNLCEHVL